MPEITKEERDFLRTVPGCCDMQDRAFLYRLASEVPEGQVIVEIGSYRGATTCALALGSNAGNGVEVFSIDPHVHLQDSTS